MSGDKSLASLLDRCRNTVNTVVSNQEIRAAIAAYGFNDKKLSDGMSLLTNVSGFFERQEKEQAEAYVASQAYIVAREENKQVFRDTVKLLRIAGKNSVELPRLIPERVDIQNTGDFYKMAHTLYQNLCNNPAHEENLQAVGLAPKFFTDQLSLLSEMDMLRVKRDKEVAEATTATAQRDMEFDQLQEYCKDLRTVAKIALKNNLILSRLINEL